MNFKVFTVKQKMLWLLLPIIIVVVLVLTVFANLLTKDLLENKYLEDMNYMESYAILALNQIDAGFAMLDSQLEKDMSEAVLTFKNLYEASGSNVDLGNIKSQMNNVYDLIVIDSETAVVDTTMPEAKGFNFTTFDPVLGEKINALRLGNDVVHERIRTNVGTGLLSKFSYVPANNHEVLLEIVYNDAHFSNVVSTLEPVSTLEMLADINPIVQEIKVYDIYGYQFTNSGEKFEPTDESLAIVKKAITDNNFEIKEEKITKRVIYLPDKGVSGLSDHSRILEISFNASEMFTLINRVSLLVFSIGLAIILITIGLIYYGVRRITTPISNLSNAAISVSGGDYEVQVIVPANDFDEISQLSRVFNTMTVKISDAYKEIENKLNITLQSMGDGLISTGEDGNVELMNKVAEEITGWSIEEAFGKSLDEVMILTKSSIGNATQSKTYYEESTIDYEILLNKMGSETAVEKSISPIFDREGLERGQVIVFRDVTDRNEKLNKIEYLSYHDQLTGAFNRRYFEGAMKRLNHSENLPITLIMIDVNGLKLINDAFGHTMGDKLLKTASQYIQSACRNEDIFSRIGGDEFVLLLPQTDTEVAELIMKRIYQEMSDKVMDKIILSLSYGIATKYDVESSLNEIFKVAEDHMYRKKLSESLSMRYQMIEVVLKTLYEKNERERFHSERVSEISMKLGEVLGLEPDEIKELKATGLMHDIGKIAIDLSLLDKPDALTSAERLEIERHPEVGYQMLKSINEFSKISEFVLSHHEKWDGSGYPRNLKGNEIPLQARIVAIADFYDAMSTERPYKNALNKQEVMEELKARSGYDFDPYLTGVFLKLLTNDIAI